MLLIHQYSMERIQTMLLDILTVLNFRLHPYSPYIDGGVFLNDFGNLSLYSNFQFFVNGVIYRYESLSINPKSITNTCLLLTWFHSYPTRTVPPFLKNYIHHSREILQRDDFEKIMRVVRQSLPMIHEACSRTEEYFNTTVITQQGKRESPTSIHQDVQY